MAMHSELYPTLPVLVFWLRLPFQGLLIAWAYWYTREEGANMAAMQTPFELAKRK